MAQYVYRAYVLELDPSIGLKKVLNVRSQCDPSRRRMLLCWLLGSLNRVPMESAPTRDKTRNSVTCICDVKRGQIVNSKASAYAMKYGLWIADNPDTFQSEAFQHHLRYPKCSW